MKLIVGLGNPGIGYVNSRHNAGYLLVDELLNQKLLKDVVIKKSGVFMNESGTFVRKFVDQYKLDPSNLYVVHDDLDIPLGGYKIQFGKGPKDHNGLNDIYDKLGTNEFWHVRIGIDPTSRGALRGEEIVLEDFTDEERKILDGVLAKICKEILPSLQ